ncbi:TrkH family potassium uptake protein [Pseudoroseicyclus sp. H15]
MRFVFFVNGLILLALGVLMTGDALVFPATRQVFLSSALFVTLIGAGVAASSRQSRFDFNFRHAFLLTSTVWLSAAAAGAVPLVFWGLRPVDGFFEALSGITTTGATVMTGLDETPDGILLWRSILQWLGGVGFIVTAIALLPAMRVGGMQLFRTESSERGQKEFVSAATFAVTTLWIYAALTTLCIFVYRAGGMSFFDAVNHGLTTLSTGGYSTSDSSFGQFDSAFLQWAGTLFMLCGSLPFAWYIRLLYRRAGRSEQVSTLLVVLSAAILFLAGWRILTAGVPAEQAFREVAFNVVSVVSTTGYATADYTLWGPVAWTAFFMLTALGGCTGSTAGGGKMMRWIILWRALVAQGRQISAPHRVSVIHYERKPLEADQLSGVIAFFTFFALTALLLALGLLFVGLDFVSAVTGALTAVTNVGPGLGSLIGPAGNFATLPDSAKWLIDIGMYVGRLEMLTVYVLFLPEFWRAVA